MQYQVANLTCPSASTPWLRGKFPIYGAPEPALLEAAFSQLISTGSISQALLERR